MPLDGIMLHGVVNELKEILIGGVIDKVSQPRKDEIVLTIRANSKNEKLLLSANANHSRINLTNVSKQNPITAPLFCMLLRKHLNRGRVIGIEQVRLERIVNIYVETYNELGDLVKKVLTIEIMGKHSNIILVNSPSNTIIDSIKHIDFELSRVREIMPGRFYELPPSKGAELITNLDYDQFILSIRSNKDLKVNEFLMTRFEGMSKLLASSICKASEVQSTAQVDSLNDLDVKRFYNTIETLKNSVLNNNLTGILINNSTGLCKDFSLDVSNDSKGNNKEKKSLNEILETFYLKKDYEAVLLSKRTNALRTVRDIYNKINKKLKIHEDTVSSAANYDINRIYGDLINSNLYTIEDGASSFSTINFYDEEMKTIDIPLDKNLTPVENSKKYYKRYNKLKKTYLFSQDMVVKLKEEIFYIESAIFNIEAASTEEDIEIIIEELQQQEYIKKTVTSKKAKKESIVSKPHHFISSGGFHIFVGKNSTQNDHLTIKTASKEDIWLHTKEIPGSHVIIKTEGNLVDEASLFEATLLAAYFSKSKMSSSVPVDYTERKNVKKPSGAKPGMVIYENYKTAYVTPSEDVISKIEKIE